MFWRVANFGNTSAVEAILDRPDFTLEDLLEEDDLIQVGFCVHSAGYYLRGRDAVPDMAAVPVPAAPNNSCTAVGVLYLRSLAASSLPQSSQSAYRLNEAPCGLTFVVDTTAVWTGSCLTSAVALLWLPLSFAWMLL